MDILGGFQLPKSDFLGGSEDIGDNKVLYLVMIFYCPFWPISANKRFFIEWFWRLYIFFYYLCNT